MRRPRAAAKPSACKLWRGCGRTLLLLLLLQPCKVPLRGGRLLEAAALQPPAATPVLVQQTVRFAAAAWVSSAGVPAAAQWWAAVRSCWELARRIGC